jgi:pyruvate/2-oxoglutarate dehydrogenase complex dihydrolipoamide dehydrogenase (E3) component
MATRVDALVIGTGQAGPSLAVRLAKAGRKVVIVEREHFGGTCVNDGCIPTKTLVASAQVARYARRAAEYGVKVGPVDVDMRAVKARKDAVVGQSVRGLESWLRGTDGLTVVWGHARFVGPRRVAVGGEEYEAEQVFVNVGGRPAIPDVPGIGAVPLLTNGSMMGVDFLPDHLVVLGGSYIGLEFAQMYRRFGSMVTVVELAPRLVPREDDDVSDEIRRFLEAEGITVHTGVGVTRVEPGPVLHLADGGVVSGSHLLVATGRRPNTDDLGLDAAGIKTDDKGYIQVDARLRTSAEGVYALGDCNGRGAFTHTSYNEYEIVAANLLDGEARSLDDRVMAYALYTDPPLARAGMSEREARKSGRPLLTARMPMSRVGRARERGETTGFMKIAVDAETKKILGAALLGVNADEVIHVILAIMYAGAPYTTLQRVMGIHPTVSELLPTLLEGLKPLDGAP